MKFSIHSLAFLRPHLIVAIGTFLLLAYAALQPDLNTRFALIVPLFLLFQLSQVLNAWEHDVLAKHLERHKPAPGERQDSSPLVRTLLPPMVPEPQAFPRPRVQRPRV